MKTSGSYWRRLLFTTFPVVLIVALQNSCAPKKEEPVIYKFPFLDPSLPTEQRVNDLVGRMTLDEKISQMINQSPAIERLGVPEYNWWSEGLHGVARAGLATVFPQAIGLAAAWDEKMMFDVSTAISDEARAKHHDFAKKGKRFIYQGLTLWSPNINIFRDPRWGRGQETYGEDPYLTGRLGVQFVKGLQGDDSTYFKTIATVKHFAVHSGPEPERHIFDATTNERDLLDTYLPQFEMGVKEGKAYSLMCAYNRYNGEACCGSDKLLRTTLRSGWGFSGFVVSDCEAITDIYKYHKIVPTAEEAAALAVKSGTDLECGKVYLNLKEAVNRKLITEEEIDVSVKRLFTARFKLGMFDPEEKVKYAQISYDVVDSKKHRDLALESARKTMVLLKNDNKTLPLKKDIGTLAVIGPNSNEWLMLLGNYNGVPADAVTPLEGIKEKVSANTKVLYAQGSELADGMPTFKVIPENTLLSEGKNGLKAEFFNNTEWKGEPVHTTVDKVVDINWSNKSPREGLDDDNFSVRWTGELVPDKTAVYQLGFISTCNTRLYLNDSIITKTIYHFRDEYGDPRLRKSNQMRLEAGKKYKIMLEIAESYADAQIQLLWARPQPELKKEALEVAKQADVIVMCMGLTARMEGEEMDVKIDGFRGGDRTKIELPSTQVDLIKSIHALGKPVVLVLLNGSALAVNWEDKNIPAILEAWYPGQASGQAIADVLFGDYNPAGRLPVTFYKSLNDLPKFVDYNITKQTYRYFKGEPLYPFGYGLSYTTFDYDQLAVKDQSSLTDSVKVSVNIKNTGEMDGEEVVQLYVSNKNKTNVPVPLRELKAFKRIELKKGESQTVEFTLAPQAFSYITDKNERAVVPGNFELAIGGGQPGTKGIKTLVKKITLTQ
jgi:beta-glucosidase